MKEASLAERTPILPAGGDPSDVWAYIESRLKERDIAILRRRWLYNDTLSKIGLSIGITRERTRQIEAKATRTLRDGPTGLNANGLKERFHWIESQLYEAVTNRGGHGKISSVETALGWPTESVRTWIALNSVIGVLNPLQKGFKSNGDFGRLVFEGSDLFGLSTLITGADGFSLKQHVEAAVGPKGIMLLEDLLNTLDRQAIDHAPSESEPAERGRALERAGVLDLLEATHQCGAQSGYWVSAGLTFPALEIARAILYESEPNNNANNEEQPDNDPLLDGLRTDLISDWLLRNSDHKSNARAISLVCERNPTVFARTGPTSWGLVAAGANGDSYDHSPSKEQSILAAVVDTVERLGQAKRFVSKVDVIDRLSPNWSGGWISQTIDQAVAKGYLINQQRGRRHYVLTVGTPISSHDRLTSKKQFLREKGIHGETSQLVLAALSNQPAGLTENDVLRSVRDIRPDTSENSVYVYLNHTYRDIIEKLPTGHYRLRHEPSRSEGQPSGHKGMSTIDILLQVLDEAVEPLSVDEITARCNQVKLVKRSSISTYLGSNYGQQFHDDGQGRYSVERSTVLSELARANRKSPDSSAMDLPQTVILNRNRARPLWCNSCGTVSGHYFDATDDLRCGECGQGWSPNHG